MAKKKTIRKWRRINPYVCEKCGKHRSSYIFDRAKEKICCVCAKNIVPDNQPSLFKEVDDMITEGVNRSPDLKI